ncbi:MAG: glyoxalase [Bdellovibrionaceae bacterium]|jgi:catechol 2,3-dioxygenase-like lactoylglutathione lyase family enzyme|nr:glyoxalase [Pseudobdellovibrionaceae bacterium]
MIKRIHHADIIISRGCEGKARKFYCEVLGLKEIEKPDLLKRNGGLWLELGLFQIHLSIEKEEGVNPIKTKAHIAYEVENLDELKKQLSSHKINTVMNKPIPGFIRCNARDPFGNRIEFLQQV